VNGKALFVMALQAILFLSADSGLFAQTETTGAVAGTVSDPSGAAVPNATITLRDLARGNAQTTTSGAAGTYRLELLTPGDYVLTVKATGFELSEQRVIVSVGQWSTLDVKLNLGAQSGSVFVKEAAAPLIQAENGNVSATINETQTQNIPNPGNDITYIAQLAPGSTMNTYGGFGNFASYGISAVSNLFTVNGMDDVNALGNVSNSGAMGLLLGQNEIQEVAVVSNGYSGEFGRLAGSNVDYVTRSGSNDFHGRATWYWNGRALNANNFFNNLSGTPRTFANANQYGADIGGPIVRDKLFFYFNAEGLYLLQPTSQSVYLPSPQFESAVTASIAAQFPANPTIQAFYSNMFGIYNAVPGGSRATNTLPDAGCDGSEPFFNVAGYTFGVASDTNPSGAGTPCALTFQSTLDAPHYENVQAGRVDWNITNNDRFFVHIRHDGGFVSYIDPISAAFNAPSNQPEYQGQAQWVHAFGSGALNQLIVAGQWYSYISKVVAADQVGFPQTLFFGDGALTNLGGINAYLPGGRAVTQFQVSDAFSRPFAAHTLRVGFQYRRNWITNPVYGQFSHGLYLPITLDALFWGGADPTVAGVNAGNYSLGQQAFPTFLEARFAVYTIGGFVEDDWKVTPNLILTFAFRLDHASNPICFTNCFVRAATAFPELSADPTIPYNQLLLVNQRQMLPSLTTVEPQPRFGFAWQPHFLGLKSTVVRGGAGIFYDTYPTRLLDGISQNLPNAPFFTVTTGTISSPSDPSSVLAAAAAANAAFQTGFRNGGSFSSISAADAAFSAPDLVATVNNPQIMRVYKWSLGVQRQFGAHTSLSLQYVGNHGSHILFQNAGINGCNATGTFVSLPACNVTNGLGVNPNFLGVTYHQSIGASNYNGMTASLTHQYTSGLFQINYTWSHALDDVSDSGFGYFNVLGEASVLFPEDPANPKKYNYGTADYDARHQLNANFVWELPIKRFITRGRGPDRLVNGWNVNGALFLRTGFPETPVDVATTDFLFGAGYGAEVFATQVNPGGAHVNCVTTFPSTPQPARDDCINPANFAASPNGFPALLRNSLTGPSYWNTDFSLIKHTKITERVEFVFGAQFYNVFNHPNFAPPVLDVSNPRFGLQTSTVSAPTTLYGKGADASPRLIQLKTQINF